MSYNEDNATTESLEQSRSLIGRYLHRKKHNTLASRTAIAHWVSGVGDRNSLFIDEGYARDSRIGAIVAPPCWLYSVDDTFSPLKFPHLHAVYGGVNWEFEQWVRVGDEITATTRLIRVEEKSGQFCGPMVLQVVETIFYNQRGEGVARAESHILRTSRERAVAKDKYRGWSAHTYTREDQEKLRGAYLNEEIRGHEPRYWEDTQEGEALPSIVKGPLTPEDLIYFINATRPTLSFGALAKYRKRHPSAFFRDSDIGMWEPWEASLQLDKAAQSFGFPAAHDCGIDRVSWLGSLITNWMGDHGFLMRLRVELKLPNIHGDATWCKGKVVKRNEASDGCVIECDVWCENQRGQTTALGQATVRLPSRKVRPSQVRFPSFPPR